MTADPDHEPSESGRTSDKKLSAGAGMLQREVRELLRLLRGELGMDIVCVMRHQGEMNFVRWVQAEPPYDALEGAAQRRLDSFCQRVFEGRLPALIPDVDSLRGTHDVPPALVPIVAYMSAPVLLHSGVSYGTVCCINFEPMPTLGDRDYDRLQLCAAQVARLIDSNLGWHDD